MGMKQDTSFYYLKKFGLSSIYDFLEKELSLRPLLHHLHHRMLHAHHCRFTPSLVQLGGNEEVYHRLF
jgi:hypothetical protein